MKTSFVALALSLLSLVSAAPANKRQSPINDAVILNYALTLEHLENTFYKEGLAAYNTKAFTDAGFSASTRERLTQISSDEQTHVDFLTAGLAAAGAPAVKACKYAFGYNDVKTFLATASILEGVGVSAYLGAAASIMEDAYLTAAGSILTVEARHSSYIRNTIGESPFPSPFDVPLTFNEVYSLAAQYIVPGSCPASNPALPVKAFPVLAAAVQGKSVPGGMVKLTPAKMDVLKTDKQIYAAWIGFPANAYGVYDKKSMTVTIPKSGFCGQSYVLLSTSKDSVTDDTVLTSPAVVEIAC